MLVAQHATAWAAAAYAAVHAAAAAWATAAAAYAAAYADAAAYATALRLRRPLGLARP